MKKASIALMILMVAAALNGCTYSSGTKVGDGDDKSNVPTRPTDPTNPTNPTNPTTPTNPTPPTPPVGTPTPVAPTNPAPIAIPPAGSNEQNRTRFRARGRHCRFRCRSIRYTGFF